MIKSNDKKIFKNSFDYWIFDLDNTLYDINLRLFNKISKRITFFIIEHLKLSEKKAKILQRKLYLKYGLTLRGLIIENNIDPDPFLDFVHDVKHPELKIDYELIKLLTHIIGKKYIYTNASYCHAKNILSTLGVFELFDGILDIKKTNYIPKPDMKSYQIMKKMFHLNQFNINKSIFIEDTIDNLMPAKKIGMTTVWIENKLNDVNLKKKLTSVDYSFTNIKSFLKFIN